MKSSNTTAVVKRRMDSPITYWGGKKLMARHILPLIPNHVTYVEPFFGGGAIYFAKEQSQVEVINDLNHFVVNFFTQVKTNFSALQKRVQATPFSRGLYKDALLMYNSPHLFTDLDRAWAFWILCNEGYASKIGTWGYGTNENKRERSIAAKRDNFLELFAQRLGETQIESLDAVRIIELRDRTQTFFYVDPPYIDSAQGHYSGYTHVHYNQLLSTLANIKGKFLLSSYPSEMLDSYTKKNGWYQLEFKQPTMASPTRKDKIEVLTANFPISTGMVDFG
jgi:DNA adenine methylase